MNVIKSKEQTSDSCRLNTLVATLREQQNMKVDTLVSASKMQYIRGKLVYEDPKFGSLILKPTDGFNGQIAKKLGIPKTYYDKLIGSDDKATIKLLDSNVNHWMKTLDRPYMIRTFVPTRDRKYSKIKSRKGTARALLSDSYNISMDNLDVLTAFLDAVRSVQSETGINLEISECNLTEFNMYARVIAPDNQVIAKELLKDYRRPDGTKVHGDDNFGVFTGLIMKNSETGHGAFSIAPMAIVSKCLNESIFREAQIRKLHVGSKQQEGVSYTRETIMARIEATKLETRDTVKTFLSTDWLDQKVRDLTEMNFRLEHPVDCVKNVANHLHFSENATDALLDIFMKSGDATAFGVNQALTWMSKHGTTDNKGEVKKMSMERRYRLNANATPIFEKMEKFDRELIKA